MANKNEVICGGMSKDAEEKGQEEDDDLLGNRSKTGEKEIYVQRDDSVLSYVKRLEDHSGDDATFLALLPVSFEILIVNFVFFMLNLFQITVLSNSIIERYNYSFEYVLALNIVNYTIILIVYPFIYGLGTVVEILGSNMFGEKKYKEIGLCLHKCRFIGVTCLVLTVFFVYFVSKKIFDYFSFFDYLAGYGVKLLIFRLLSLIFDLEFFMLFKFLIVIRNNVACFLMAIASGLLFKLVSYVCITHYDLAIYGPCITYLTCSVLNCFIIWAYILIAKPLSHVIFCLSSFCCSSNICSYMWMVFRLSLIAFLDIIRIGIFPIFMSFYSPNIKYTILLGLNVYAVSAAILMSFESLTTILLSFYNGKDNDTTTAKKVYRYLWVYALFAGVVILGFCFLFQSQLYGVFFKGEDSEDVVYITKLICLMGILCNILNSPLEVALDTLKSLGEFGWAVTIFFWLNILNVVFIYLMMFVFSHGMFGVLLGHIINLTLQNIIVMLMLECYFNWNESYQSLAKYKED